MMIIYSPTTEYTVLTRGGFKDHRMVARDGFGNTRLLVLVHDSEEARRLLPLLLDFREDVSFSDFIEFFPNGDELVAVFAYRSDGTSLDQVLSAAPNPLRAVVLRSLFAQILLQSLPEAILREVMRPENMLATPSGQVRLLYDLPRETETYDSGGELLAAAVKRISGERTAPEVTVFAEKLASGIFSNYAEMYSAADNAAFALAEFIPALEVKKWTFETAKAKVKTSAGNLKTRWLIVIAAIALLIGYIAVGVLFYKTVIDPLGVDNNIRSIGTVVVADDP